MRKKIAVALAAGTLGVSGLALSVPAFAGTTPSPSATSPGATSPGSTGSASPLDAITSALKGLVSDRTLTQAQADKVASTLSTAGIGRGGPGGHGGGGRGFGGGPGGDLTSAAKALGISEADLRTALESGQTLAQVAKTKNVPVDTLVAALVKAEKARIAQAVADGKLPQAEADEHLADLTTRITDRVNSTRPAHGRGDGGGRPGGGADTPAPSVSPSSS